MIASSRLRRIERVAKTENERQRAIRIAAGKPTVRDRAEQFALLLAQAEACRVRGDRDNKVVRNAARIQELFKAARQRIEQAGAAH